MQRLAGVAILSFVLALLALLPSTSWGQTYIQASPPTNQVPIVTPNGLVYYPQKIGTPIVKVGWLPAYAFTGVLVSVTDGASSSDCSIGGGLELLLCQYNGSTWQAVAGGGVGSNVEVNTTLLSSSSTINFENSAATNGLTLSFTNPSGGNVQLGFSGQLSNAGLANSSATVNDTTCTLGASCFAPVTDATFVADTSYTVGLLGCPTSTGKVANCASGVNPPVVGVLLAKSGSNAHFAVSGSAAVTFQATTPVTFGDFICVDATNAGMVVDSGATPCTTKQIGVVVTTAATATTQTVFVQMGKN
jgi:hypothetical protein